MLYTVEGPLRALVLEFDQPSFVLRRTKISHVATVRHQFKSLEALRSAGRRCGLELIMDARSFRNYNGRMTPCDHVLRVTGNTAAWEIGIKAKGVEYDLLYDGFMGGAGLIEHTRNQHGDLNRLITYYEEEAALEQFTAEGWMVERIEHSNGDLELIGTR